MKHLRIIITATCAILALWLVMSTAGCTNHTVKESLTVEVVRPDNTRVTLRYRPEMATWSLLSFTGVEDTEHVTPLSSTFIGKIETEPDPNSIQATGGLLGKLAEAIIKP